jgi:methyl-accepting chemotaxis protein
MSIAKKFRYLAIATVCVIASLVCLLVLTALAEGSLNSAQTARQESYRLAVLLRQTSDDLTRLVRAYVVTSNPDFEREYAQLDARQSGKASWPDGRTISIREMMNRAGMAAEELAKLNESDKYSNDLVATETAAFNAVKGLFDDGSGQFTRQGAPDLELARRLVHDSNYEAARERINAPIRDFERMLDARTQRQVQDAMARSRICIAFTGILVLCTAVLVFVSLRSVNSMLKRTADQLERGAHELSSAAGQVSTSSQLLAQGSSEQAASLEETSAAAEEVQAVAQANARHADSASALVVDSERVNGEMDTQFEALTHSMSEITDSSHQISRIIRTVDEIAFQTNILALNAAVEAARAGEAGMGFAVVADEVRNLAHRAGDAAKETGALIEEAIRTTAQGKSNLDRAVATLNTSRSMSQNLASLIRDVSTGSREQASGIEHIARAVLQMREVTQQTAATAEESAAASEEMTAQADTVLQLAQDLREAVGGKATA